MSIEKRKLFITNALPYANGDIHLGHLLGYIQGDIWARFHRMCNSEVHFICADDAHGAPIMIRAEKLGITPKELINKAQKEHLQDFEDFHIKFDNYHTTDSEENRKLVSDIYLKLKAAGLIETREIQQFFDEEKAMFLPDRFIKGECPKCHAKDQYGDNCEVCGGVYQPTELINPFSAVSGNKPVMKGSEHFFFKLSDERCVKFLRDFLANSDRLQPEAANKMKEWLGTEEENKLSDWDISRDAPYFGFPIPNEPNKYFYVWLDAPVGYLASLANYIEKNPQYNFAEYTEREAAEKAGTEMIHFIGKDIMYFHTLFWPAMLNFSGYRLPTQYAVNGFITVNGAKMSKSRGTFITARSYLDEKLNPEWLRYYFAAKSSGAIDDLDLNMEDLVNRVNSDLVGKFINIASRTSKFVSSNFNNQLSTFAEETSDLLNTIRGMKATILAHYEDRNFAAAMREIARGCDLVNESFDTTKPWELAKDEAQHTRLQSLCTSYLEAFRLLSIYLFPVLPETIKSIGEYLNNDLSDFSATEKSLENATINNYEHLMKRIELKQLDQLVERNKASLQASEPVKKVEKSEKSEKANKKKEAPVAEEGFINIDDFAKVDLRLGKVLHCDFVEGSDKLLAFTVDLGEEKPRNIFSGIRSAYGEPQLLIGKYVIVVANLAPRKMRFGVSEGMILSASLDGDLALLTTLSELKPGAKVS